MQRHQSSRALAARLILAALFLGPTTRAAFGQSPPAKIVFQKPSVATLMEVASTDGNDKNRLAAVQQLVIYPTFKPEILAALERIAKQDTHPEVRRAARLGAERYRVASRIGTFQERPETVAKAKVSEKLRRPDDRLVASQKEFRPPKGILNAVTQSKSRRHDPASNARPRKPEVLESVSEPSPLAARRQLAASGQPEGRVRGLISQSLPDTAVATAPLPPLPTESSPPIVIFRQSEPAVSAPAKPSLPPIVVEKTAAQDSIETISSSPEANDALPIVATPERAAQVLPAASTTIMSRTNSGDSKLIQDPKPVDDSRSMPVGLVISTTATSTKTEKAPEEAASIEAPADNAVTDRAPPEETKQIDAIPELPASSVTPGPVPAVEETRSRLDSTTSKESATQWRQPTEEELTTPPAPGPVAGTSGLTIQAQPTQIESRATAPKLESKSRFEAVVLDPVPSPKAVGSNLPAGLSVAPPEPVPPLPEPVVTVAAKTVASPEKPSRASEESNASVPSTSLSQPPASVPPTSVAPKESVASEPVTKPDDSAPAAKEPNLELPPPASAAPEPVPQPKPNPVRLIQIPTQTKEISPTPATSRAATGESDSQSMAEDDADEVDEDAPATESRKYALIEPTRNPTGLRNGARPAPQLATEDDEEVEEEIPEVTNAAGNETIDPAIQLTGATEPAPSPASGSSRLLSRSAVSASSPAMPPNAATPEKAPAKKEKKPATATSLTPTSAYWSKTRAARSGPEPKSLMPLAEIPRDPKARKEKAKQMLLEGRRLLAEGRIDEAESTVARLREFAIRFSRFEDSPELLERDVSRARLRAAANASAVAR